MVEFVDGQARDGLVAGSTFATITIVDVGGGPAGLALLVAVITGMLVNAATNRVSVVQVVGRMATAFKAARASGTLAELRMSAGISGTPRVGYGWGDCP